MENQNNRPLQQNVAGLAAQLTLHVDQLERWAGELQNPHYSEGDDEPLNLAARLEATWRAQVPDLRTITRALRDSAEWR